MSEHSHNQDTVETYLYKISVIIISIPPYSRWNGCKYDNDANPSNTTEERW